MPQLCCCRSGETIAFASKIRQTLITSNESCRIWFNLFLFSFFVIFLRFFSSAFLLRFFSFYFLANRAPDRCVYPSITPEISSFVELPFVLAIWFGVSITKNKRDTYIIVTREHTADAEVAALAGLRKNVSHLFWR